MGDEVGGKTLDIETEDTIYEIEFGQIQIEITGRCNMRCQHCRAAFQLRNDMPIEQIVKIIRFVAQFGRDHNEIVLSGGEPLLHRDFDHVLESIRAEGTDSITLTTNGSLLTEGHLRLLERLSFTSVGLSVSLDSLTPETHDRFRGHQGAFARANAALRLVGQCNIPGVVPSMRSTIRPTQIREMESLVEHARSLGCKRIGFSAVHPVGRALSHEDLWMTKDQKREFLCHVNQLRDQFKDISVTTNDPLQCLVDGTYDEHNGCFVDNGCVNGCGAGVVTFNVDTDGTLTPCALLPVPIMNVFPLSIEEMTEHYRTSSVVKDLLLMNFRGKCGNCTLRLLCGGCRARALAQLGDYLQEDPHCWKS